MGIVFHVERIGLHVELTHPRALTFQECALHTVDLLEVLVSHFLLVPRRAVLGEVIGQILFAGSPDEVELTLFDAVLHPPVAHVERFGELLAHFGIKDALGSAVVSFREGIRCWVVDVQVLRAWLVMGRHVFRRGRYRRSQLQLWRTRRS